jgi:ferrochelatase
MNKGLPVFYISFGGPEAPEQVMPFLESVTRGRGIPRERLLAVAEHYRHIGGKSPIGEITRRQAETLEVALAAAGDPRKVYIGQRHSPPFIEDALRRMKDDGVAEAVGFVTAAYRSEASLERYVEAVDSARASIGPDAPRVHFVGPWFDHPLFIEAVSERVRGAAFPPGVPWVFTAHSIPCAMAKSSTYVEELRAATSAVAAACGKKDWSLAFTSRSGNPRDAWLEPDISKVIAVAAAAGVEQLALIPIGFIADHVEVLYDLDIEAKAAADKAGVRLLRAPTVGDHPLFIRMIAEVVRSATPADPALAVNSARTVYRDGRTAAAVGRESSSCFCFPGEAEPPCRRPIGDARPPQR